MKITLSLWDIAGQERFDFFKTDFFNGVAAVALVFDLSRPDTFENIDEYFSDLRERSGNIPIVLVGNKDDLKRDIGETIAREKILQKVNQYNLFEYMETSALENKNVNKLFYRLSILCLLDFRARLGEVVDSDHFRFKVLLVGAAAVGKSSLINAFVEKGIDENYKLTVGLDFMTQDLKIQDADLPKETLELIKKSVKEYKKLTRKFRKREELEPVQLSNKQKLIYNNEIKDTITDYFIRVREKDKKEKKTRKYFSIIALIIILVIILIYMYFYFFR